jgi:nucleotide-binding universal stress UspA family protein
VGALATRFKARLIGVAAGMPQTVMAGGASVGGSQWYDIQRDDIEKRLDALQRDFTTNAGTPEAPGWASYIDTPDNAVLAQAHRADLIVTGPHRDHIGGDPLRSLNPSHVVIAAGRPVLVLASTILELRAAKVVVGWKDTRESRRALSDALPFLKTAGQVMLVAAHEEDIDAERQSLSEVGQWLKAHDIEPVERMEDGSLDAADTLLSVADETGADLIVAGAYGHSRLREWLLGGATRELLLASHRISLLLSN